MGNCVQSASATSAHCAGLQNADGEAHVLGLACASCGHFIARQEGLLDSQHNSLEGSVYSYELDVLDCEVWAYYKP